MVEVFDFFLKQENGLYPDVSNRLCRIPKVRVLRFPGFAINDLILYKVEVQDQQGSWSPVETLAKQDKNWFGFVRKPVWMDAADLLGLCHRHFLQRILTGVARFSVREYLHLYKRESIYPVSMTSEDGRPLEYWDTMLIRALELQEDGVYYEKTYGSVKIRERFVRRTTRPEEPYRSGVLYSFPISTLSMSAVHEKIERNGRHPSLWERARPIAGSSLEIFHAAQPETGT